MLRPSSAGSRRGLPPARLVVTTERLVVGVSGRGGNDRRADCAQSPTARSPGWSAAHRKRSQALSARSKVVASDPPRRGASATDTRSSHRPATRARRRLAKPEARDSRSTTRPCRQLTRLRWPMSDHRWSPAALWAKSSSPSPCTGAEDASGTHRAKDSVELWHGNPKRPIGTASTWKRRWGIEAPNRLRSPFALGRRSRYAVALFAGQLVFALLLFAASVLAGAAARADGRGVTAWTLATMVAALALAARSRLDSDGRISAPNGWRWCGPRFDTGRWRWESRRWRSRPRSCSGRRGGARVPASWSRSPPPSPPTTCWSMQAAKRAWSQQAIRIAMAAVVAVGMTGLLIAPADDRLDIAFESGRPPRWHPPHRSARRTPAPGSAARRAKRRHCARGAARRKVLLARLIDFLLLRIDQFIVVAITGPFGLAYSVAVNWSEISWYVGAAIGQAVFEDRRTLGQRSRPPVLYRAGWILGFTTMVVTIAGSF